jgi:CheY-like chemotaxis protein
MDDATSNLKVMIIEDEGIVAMLLEDMLNSLGHEVVASASNIEGATKLVADAQIDLAILDVNLNGHHTYSIAETLTSRGIPFIFATGYGNAGLKSEWRAAKVLQKPFTERDLAQLIGQTVSSPKA